jgi:hypothetical protein
MSPYPLRVLAVALLAAAACGGGSGAERQAFDRRHAICSGLVNSRTLRQAAQDFGPVLVFFGGTSECRSDLVPVPGGGDHCTYQAGGPAVCRSIFEWFANDPDLCNQGRCFYFCDVRTMKDAAVIGADQLSDATVCGTEWVSGQNAF